MNIMELNKTFIDGLWSKEINVTSFVQTNITPYLGDASFLAGPTERTKHIWNLCLKALEEERQHNGVRALDNKTVSTVTSHKAGYIDRENELIVGLQTDELLKRAIKPFGGINVVSRACKENGVEVDEKVKDIFTHYRKTHNDGVFDVYTEEIRSFRSLGFLTGLPDNYARGRIIGDYRRLALYGTDRLIEAKQEDLRNLTGPMTDARIRLREEVAEQIKALKDIRTMGEYYGLDLSRPAHSAQEAVQWVYMAYLAAVKEQDGAAMSLGNVSSFLDIFIEYDLAHGTIDESFAQELIDYTDKIYLEFGADPHVEGIYTGEEIKEIRKNAIHAGLKLVDCPIRHLGTEKAQELYLAIQNYLADNGVEMRFNTECENIILEEEGCKGVLLKDGDSLLPVYADEVVIGTGRRGADWLEKLCAEHHIAHKPGTVDIGVRVECRNEVMEKVNKVLYESKLIGYPKPWKNKVRTFCQNPGGFVAQENYDNDLAVVNGHSFKEKKSPNTNLAILVSHNFTEPFNQPIAYAQKVGELTNMLGAGHIMVQRYGDILDGKRTWQKELAQSNVKPTLKDAVAGDITAAMPYRAMTNIIEFIKMLDMVVPGFAANETLLYSPELKFYSNKVKMDSNLDTNIKGLHCLGDSSGWTRGLMMASVMGVLMGRKLAEKEGC